MATLFRGALIGGAVLAAALPATGQQTDADPDTMRVCASTKDAPYSTADLDGFENRIAEIIADEAGLTLEMVQVEKDAIFLHRDGIEQDICEVIIGVDEGDERMLTSEPYYRSAYAFVARQDRGFEGHTWQDIDQEGYDTFAYRYHSPAETILKYSGRYEYNLIYQASLVDFEDRRNQYTQVPAERVVDEVSSGKADLGILFAPEAARFVKDSREPLEMTLITDRIERSDGLVIPLQYSQSVGVADDSPELLEKIDAALESGSARIRAVLEEEGIPTLPMN
ncbi:methanol oxidation system protein MoxJ [Roseovarius atlanticus]|uniref:methanol oxidation system protein MoxJ n=1 Tax=Roseovarius atlanticus TaxID=1641875 RepID=UPI0021BD9BE6|nr:methanol oxidation system protein MoxJ [Roseovarius atlanticus]